MTILVLFILAVIWAAVLLPPYLQSRSESRPADSISSFQNQLSVLERRTTTVNPALRSRPSVSISRAARYNASLRLSRAEAKRRRAEVLFTLAAAAGLTFLSAVILGGPVWVLHLACDLLLAGYVVLLAQAQQRAEERATKVRYLPTQRQRPHPQRAPEPVFLLRRSGS